MKKYLSKRILFSLFSFVVVVLIVMILIYGLIDRRAIFQTDDTWNKRSNNDRIVYEYSQYQRYGYLEYNTYSTFLQNKYQEKYGDSYADMEDYIQDKNALRYPKTYEKNTSVKEFLAKYKDELGYEIIYLEPITYKTGQTKPGGTPALLAVNEKPMLTRLWDYAKNFFDIEGKNDIVDPELTERYIRVEKDPYSNFYAVVGSGTTHKYLLYVNDRFPFIHQNWLHMNLGTSYTRYRGQEISTVITDPVGDMVKVKTQYPAKLGTDEYVETALDFHKLYYNVGKLTDAEKENFPDKYTLAPYRRDGLSMLENSFVTGLIATIIAYLLGLPLGILMARKKDTIFDKIGNAYVIFIMSVPSLAYIFLFSAIGTTVFGLPYKFANAEVKVLAYILPIVSLSLPQVGSLMKWMRRYMIDQMNSDYVKFARAEGLSESEIYKNHISKNAIIPIIHGIPGSVLGCLTGAIITESVYSLPGVGSLLTQAINTHDNGIIVACTVFYTLLSIVSLIMGDLLMAKYDPRISFETKAGR